LITGPTEPPRAHADLNKQKQNFRKPRRHELSILEDPIDELRAATTQIKELTGQAPFDHGSD
jgi:hypothetical protein